MARPEKMGVSAPVDRGGGLILMMIVGASRPKLGDTRSLPSWSAATSRIGMGDSRWRETGRGWGDGGGEAMGESTRPASLSTGALSLLLGTSAEGGGGEEVLLPMVMGWWCRVEYEGGNGYGLEAMMMTLCLHVRLAW